MNFHLTQDYLSFLSSNVVSSGHTHHVVPRFLGGDDSPSNLVTLSASSHLTAHWKFLDCVEDESLYWAKAVFALHYLAYRPEVLLLVSGAELAQINALKSKATSILQMGMLWWNNGIIEATAKECPGEGWVRGRRMNITSSAYIAMADSIRGTTWFNDGINEKRATEAPGPEWSQGRLGTQCHPWWHNPSTGHRTKAAECPGQGYIRGRGKNKQK